MARKQRIDSTTAAVRIMQGATKQMSPPSHVPLDDCDWPFWESVVAEFARAEWSEHQLELAAMLARTMANLEREQRNLRTEGFTAKSERGTPVQNPLAGICKGLTGDILALRRSLALHARAKAGDNRDAAKQRDQGLGIETDLGDELLARPVYQ
jgi:hypothetical protein